MHKITGIFLLAIFVIGGAIFYLGYGKVESRLPSGEVYENTNTQVPVTYTSRASYTCAENKIFSVGYTEGIAEITLPAREKITLEQVVSASGTKFSNEGLTLVFWTKGDEAYIEQDGKITYSECSILTMSGGEIEILEAAVNQTITTKNISITPLTILEDSRCPVDVVCVQAGTVRVSAWLKSGLGEARQEFKLGQAVTTEAEEIKLVRVLPAKYSSKEMNPPEYRFYFEIKKR